MPAGRPPKPTSLKLLQGNPGKRRLNKDEPEFDPANPAPPEVLDEEARTEWYRLIGGLRRSGVLTESDTATFAAYCMAFSRWVQAERALQRMREADPVMNGLMLKTSNGNIVQNPMVGLANTAMRDMAKFAGELGITPASRSRVTKGKPTSATGNRFSGF